MGFPQRKCLLFDRPLHDPVFAHVSRAAGQPIRGCSGAPGATARRFAGPADSARALCPGFARLAHLGFGERVFHPPWRLLRLHPSRRQRGFPADRRMVFRCLVGGSRRIGRSRLQTGNGRNDRDFSGRIARANRQGRLPRLHVAIRAGAGGQVLGKTQGKKRQANVQSSPDADHGRQMRRGRPAHRARGARIVRPPGPLRRRTDPILSASGESAGGASRHGSLHHSRCGRDDRPRRHAASAETRGGFCRAQSIVAGESGLPRQLALGLSHPAFGRRRQNALRTVISRCGPPRRGPGGGIVFRRRVAAAALLQRSGPFARRARISTLLSRRARRRRSDAGLGPTGRDGKRLRSARFVAIHSAPPSR
ncbi:MAG: hypothetical protein BWZ10_01199 [candidate division BRC1 bacterium ADurb.BinA364]|nr:MAG: hypothetical protein BWZ10_01199 [candidate division BRC1 bacterium ADurb.BinA364]